MLGWMAQLAAGTIFLATLRVLGIFLAAPVLSHWAMPVRLRVALSLVIAVAVMPTLPAAAVPAGSIELLLAGAVELGIGAVIGFAARLVFVGIEMAASYVGQQMGLSLIEALNPTVDEEGGATVRLYEMLALVIFLGIGGHQTLISALLGSFQSAPLMSFGEPAAVLKLVTGLLAASFALALKTALPVVLTLILATVAMGLLQRSIPQLNIFSAGLPMTVLLGLLTLAAAVAVLGHAVSTGWAMTMQQIGSWTGTT